MRLKTICHLVCTMIMTAAVASCAPAVHKSDDGHHAWARQVVVTLFGRQAAGEAEVRVVADLAALVGRRAAAEGLMDSPEFVAYWSDLLVDLVRAPREGNKSLASCVGTPMRSGPTTAALANWVRDNPPSSAGAPGGSFNLADLLASSIVADDLSPFLRGYAFAFASRPLSGNEITELNKRDDLYSVFEGTLLGRNSTCLACHNAAWSVTGLDSGWNRTFAPLGYFERSLFGAHSGPADPKRVKALMRVGGVNGLGTAPWGISGCGNFQAPTTDDPELAAGEEAFLAGAQGRRASLFTVEQLFRAGIVDLRNGLDRSVAARDTEACTVCGSCPAGSTNPVLDTAQQAREDAVRSLFANKGCFTCHGSGSGSGGLRMRNDATWKDQLVRVASVVGTPTARVDPGHSDRSFLIRALDPAETLGGAFPMPPIGSHLSAPELSAVRDWIDGMPNTSGCDTCASNSPGLICPAPRADVRGDEALAYLVALNLTDNIWAQVMGRPLTIAHTFSRNLAQSFLLWHMTEYRFIENGWSLKKLLAFIVTSDYYNRRPPEDGDGITTPAGGSSPYDIPMFFDPWVAQDPRIPPATDPGYVAANHPDRHRNSMSEAVERKAPVNLLRSVAAALGWPAPQRVPESGYPSRDLAVSIGQFMRDSVPGFRGENFGAFVEWEASIATCRKPTGVTTDWIDRLETAIVAHNNAHSSDRVTVEQAAEIVKDWLLADGRMTSHERVMVANLFGKGQSEPVTGVANLNSRLRDYCGVLLQTPHFKLAGLTTDGVGHPPKLRVCNGTPCSYREICTAFTGRMTGRFSCDDDSIQQLMTVVSILPLQERTVFARRQSRPLALDLANQTQGFEIAFNILRNLSADPLRFRLAVRPDQLRRARVAEVRGVAMLDARGLTVLAPGQTIPPDAIVLAEKGALLHLSIDKATVPVPLLEQGLPEGTIAQLDQQLADIPRTARERLVKAAREAIFLADLSRPEHALSPVPRAAMDTAMWSAFPFGSAGEPIRRDRKREQFDSKALQDRFDRVRRIQE